METKICIDCKKELPATSEYFGKHKTCKDGLRNQCKECKKKYSDKYNKQYYKDNAEVAKEKAKTYRENNKEKVKEGKKRYRLTHLEQERENKRLYCKQNKDKINNLNQKRKARKKKLISTLTSKQWNEIKIKFNNRCAYCGEEKPLAQDHFIPLSKGGEYTVNNIIPACKNCNSSKHDFDFFKWYRKQECYSEERERKILNHLGYKNNVQQLKII